jgi:hypothetical protein
MEYIYVKIKKEGDGRIIFSKAKFKSRSQEWSFLYSIFYFNNECSLYINKKSSFL